jgi:hypothetical protein
VVGRQLGDGRSFADAVHADHHDHEGNATLQDLHLAVAARAFQQGDHLLAQDFARQQGVRHVPLAHTVLEVAYQLLADIPADIAPG